MALFDVPRFWRGAHNYTSEKTSVNIMKFPVNPTSSHGRQIGIIDGRKLNRQIICDTKLTFAASRKLSKII